MWPINKQVYDWEKHIYYTSYDGYIDELKIFVNTHIPYLQEAFAERLATSVGDAPRLNDKEKMIYDKYYDLNGRLVIAPDRRGIYIQNHKKIVRQ